jgi:hypothetical protein
MKKRNRVNLMMILKSLELELLGSIPITQRNKELKYNFILVTKETLKKNIATFDPVPNPSRASPFHLSLRPRKKNDEISPPVRY